MQFTVSKSELLNALQIAGKCVGGNIMPAHSNYLFDWNKTNLSVSATDGERFMTYKCSVDGEESFLFQLPVKELSEMVKLLPDQPLIFSIKGITVHVQHSSGEFELPFDAGIEYPKPTHKEKLSVSIPSISFLGGLGRVLFATSQDFTRPNLMGVYLEFGEKGINYTAANGPVLSTVHQDGEYKINNVLITQKTVSTIQGLPVEENITVSIGETSIIVKPNENTEFWCRIIDEKYPPYKNFIPASNENILTVDRQHLLSALNRVRVFGKSVEDMLLVNISLGAGVVLSTTNLLSQSTKEQITASYSGDELSVDFNCKLLINCLSRISADIVYLHFKDEKSPFIITESEKEYGETLMLTMPYKI